MAKCECHNQMVALGDGTCFPKKSPLATDDVRIFLGMGRASASDAKKSHADLTMAHSYIYIWGYHRIYSIYTHNMIKNPHYL